jgi:hypothetical protein
MKGVWKWSLGLTLGLVAGRASADQGTLQSAAAPAATLARPVPAGTTATPAVSLSKPIAIVPGPRSGVTDAQVKPVAFSWPDLSKLGVVARAQNTDAARPMPVGPTGTDDGVLKMPTKITAESGPTLEPGPVPPPPGAVGLPPGAVGLPPGAVGLPPGAVGLPPGAVGLPPGATGPVVGSAVCGDGSCCDGPCCVEADSCCSPAGACCPGSGHNFYISAEYLMWFFKNTPTPPLVTQAFGTAGTPGALSDPGTMLVFGGGSGLASDVRSGARFTAGYWFDDEQVIGVEGSFFFIGQRGDHFTAGGGPGGIGFYRPFFSIEQGFLPVAEEVSGSFPVNASGTVRVDLESRLWGAEADFRHNLLCGPWYRLDLVEGFRFLSLEESLQVNENITTLSTPGNDAAPPAGTNFVVTDRFATQNRFYGGEVGTISEFHWGNWFLDLKSKVALGAMRESTSIIGNTSINAVVMPGGLLALPSNMGLHARDRFAVVTDCGLNIGYQLTDQFRLYAGYSFLYMSSVLRPGDQVDLAVSRSQLPGAATPRPVTGPTPAAPAPAGQRSPMFAFQGTDFWAHGVNFGLEFRY